MVKQAHSEELEELSSIPQVGEVIAGKYRVDSELGSGGMGVVLCATHLDLGQRVAIKVLTVSDEDERRDEARSRFLREGRATAALVSDHVVRVYDVGTLESGAPFMVMELLRGYDLARILLQQGPLSIERACDCVRQAADAIACAHAQNIVHRDLKPSNLFLTQRSDGTPLVKVLDFGISKTTGAEPERITSNLTADRSVLGTPFYMSPEQVRDAKAVDQRTDIWSLGLILHELLSGSPAFEGTTLPGVCAAIAADPPAALRLKRPEVPPEVEAIVLRCLEKDPAKRFQSARELVAALAPWTGRAEPSTFSDATVRSSSGHGFEELRAGDTIALTPPSDTGTLASAVFTRSGPRLKGFGAVSHTKSDATLAEPPLAPHSTPVNERGFGRRGKVTLAVGGVLLLALAGWEVRGTQPREPQPTPSAAAQPTLPAPLPPPAAPPAPAPAAVATSASFSLQIDSNPAGAEVFEADHLLGTTPLQLSVDSARAPRTFALRKSGYLPYTIVQDASAKDAHVLAELAKAPSNAALHPAVKKPVVAKEPSKEPKPGSDIFMQR